MNKFDIAEIQMDTRLFQPLFHNLKKILKNHVAFM